LKEMTMRAEAVRAGKRFKHAVTALSVMSYESGQKHFYKTLAAMTDRQLLAALEAGSTELSISGAPPPVHQPIPPAPQPTSQYPATPSRSTEDQQAQPTAVPSRPKKEAVPLQAGQPDRHLGWGRQQGASQGTDSQAQPGTSFRKQPRADQQAEEAPQAQLPEATPDPPANEKKTHQSRKKAIKRYWVRKFQKGE
jgi:hypothetical protein